MKKKLAPIILVLLTLASFVIGLGMAQAQEVTFHPPLETTDAAVMVNTAINAVLGIVGVVALVAFIWAGFSWMISGGDSAKITKARKTMIWAVAGLVIIFAAYGILTLLFTAFGY